MSAAARSPTSLRLLSCVSAVSFFLFGYDTGIVSGAFTWVEDALGLSSVESEVLVGSTTAAAAVSAVFAGHISARFGRRLPILLSSLLFTFGAFLMALAPASRAAGFATLLFGRVAVGTAIGFASMAVPLYIGEVAPAEDRGFLLVVNDLSVVSGQVAAGLVNVACGALGRRWRVSLGLAAAPSLLQLCGFAWLPESPRWLAAQGRAREAREVLVRLRSSEGAAEEELQRAEEEARRARVEREHLGSGLGLVWRAWGEAPLRRAMTLGVMLMAMNQLAGINLVMYYSTTIMEMAGFGNGDAVLIACACDVAQLLGVLYSLRAMDRLGRRRLALQSSALVAPTLLLLAVGLWARAGWLSVLAVMLYLPAFGSGLSGVPWTVNGEIYPLGIRAEAVAQATAANWLFNSAVSLSFLSLVDAIGVGATFVIYLCATLLGALWLWRYMPETKGLDLESVKALFEGDKPPPPFRAREGTPAARRGGGGGGGLGLGLWRGAASAGYEAIGTEAEQGASSPEAERLERPGGPGGPEGGGGGARPGLYLA